MPTPDYDASSDMAASILPDRLRVLATDAPLGTPSEREETAVRSEAQGCEFVCEEGARGKFPLCEISSGASRMRDGVTRDGASSDEHGYLGTGGFLHTCRCALDAPALPTLLYALDVLAARAAGATIEEAHGAAWRGVR